MPRIFNLKVKAPRRLKETILCKYEEEAKSARIYIFIYWVLNLANDLNTTFKCKRTAFFLSQQFF